MARSNICMDQSNICMAQSNAMAADQFMFEGHRRQMMDEIVGIEVVDRDR